MQQFHVWHDDWLEQGDWLETVEALKQEGKIRFFGVSINDHAPDTALELVRSGHVDTVQVIYNVFDQSPEDELFPAVRGARRRRARARAVRRGRPDRARSRPTREFPEGDFRARYFRGDRKREVAERVQAIVDDLGIARRRACRRSRCATSSPLDAVSTVIPGMRSIRNVERNMRRRRRPRARRPSRSSSSSAHRWVRDWYR